MFPFIQKWTFYNIDILSVKSVESSFKLEIYMKYCGNIVVRSEIAKGKAYFIRLENLRLIS